MTTIVMLMDAGGDAEATPEVYVIRDVAITASDRVLLHKLLLYKTKTEDWQTLFLLLDHDELWLSLSDNKNLGRWKAVQVTTEALGISYPKDVTHLSTLGHLRVEALDRGARSDRLPIEFRDKQPLERAHTAKGDINLTGLTHVAAHAHHHLVARHALAAVDRLRVPQLERELAARQRKSGMPE